MNIVSYRQTFWQILKTDLVIFRKMYYDKFIDLMIWVITTTAAFGYLMPAFGLDASYASFTVAGLCASAGLFEVFPSVMDLANDFEGERKIDYYLTLPLPSWLVFLRYIIYFGLSAAALGIFVLPVGKLILWYIFDLSNFNVFKFLAIFVVTNLFYGAFTLWIASRIENAMKIGNVWMRLVYPLWFVGGFQFTWFVLHAKWPLIGYASLLNPITYVMEGTRASLLGQAGYLPYLACVLMLIVFTLALSAKGIKNLKRKLDFV